MPYILPTASQFITRFPIFMDEDEARITMIIQEASATVDQSWVEADYQPAILYLAAHLLATDNSGEGDQIDFSGSPGGLIASENFGPFGVSYNKSAGAADAGPNGWGSTEFGRRFQSLLRRNKPGILAI